MPPVYGMFSAIGNTYTQVAHVYCVFTPSAAVIAAYDNYRVNKVRAYFMPVDVTNAGSSTSLPVVACHDPSIGTAPTNCLQIMRYANKAVWAASNINPKIEEYTIKNPTNLMSDGTLLRDFIKTDAAWTAGVIWCAGLWPNNAGTVIDGLQYVTWVEFDVELSGNRVDI